MIELSQREDIIMKKYNVENMIQSARLGSVRLGGYVGEHIDKVLYTRLLSEYAKNQVYPEAEGAFVSRVDDELGAFGIWQGEYWGKWMIGAARAARYLNLDELREKVRQSAITMIGYQEENGYLGTYRDSKNFFPPSEEYIEQMGLPARFNWNIWCRKYTLWGMLEAYELTKDDKMLTSARRMADALLLDLEQTGADICDTGTFVGMASASIMKPMLILYRHTENEKYLNFVLNIARRWEKRDIPPALIANALAGAPISEWYPESNKWAKAYEMMSCFDGIIELYRVTGEEKYLTASERFYDILITHEQNPLGSVAYNDMFGDASCDVNTISEPCDVIHFMRICHELFLLTGKVKYMDSFERAAYTPMLASGYKDGKWGARGLRGAGRHLTALLQAKFIHNHCCVNNLPRGYLNIAESALTIDGEILYINLYSELSGRMDIGGRCVDVKISGDYLGECRANISLAFEGKPLHMKLRVPDWSKHTKFKTGHSECSPEGGYFDTILEHSGDIVAEFDNSIQVTYLTPHPTLANLAWKRDRWLSAYHNPDDKNDFAAAASETFLEGGACILHRGPTLLCRSKLIGNTEKEMFAAPTLSPSDKCISCQRIYETDNIHIEYLLTFASGKQYRVCDYASGTNMNFADKHSFSIYF